MHRQLLPSRDFEHPHLFRAYTVLKGLVCLYSVVLLVVFFVKSQGNRAVLPLFTAVFCAASLVWLAVKRKGVALAFFIFLLVCDVLSVAIYTVVLGMVCVQSQNAPDEENWPAAIFGAVFYLSLHLVCLGGIVLVYRNAVNVIKRMVRNTGGI